MSHTKVPKVLRKFLVGEADKLHVEAVVTKLAELDGQQVNIPLGVLGRTAGRTRCICCVLLLTSIFTRPC